MEIVITSSRRGNAMQSMRSDLDKTGKSVKRFGGALKNVASIAGGFLAASAIQGGFNKLTGFLGDSISLAKEQAAVEAQLNAVIASTGGAAGVSAEQIKKMASGFQEITNFGDEATIASSNVLLTFTKIGGDVFPRAQKSVLDMSAALGQDLQSSSIQVGKALNDPIRGVTALQRVGITFSDKQRDMIRTLQETGDIAGAQAVILKELETQFKGSAEAAVEADGGIQQAENAIGDLQEQIGTKMIPIMAKFKQAQLAVVQAVVDRLLPAFEKKILPVLIKVRKAIVPLIKQGWERLGEVMEGLRPSFRAVGEFLSDVADKVREFANSFRTGFTEDEGTRVEALGLKLRKFKELIVNEVVPAVRRAAQKLAEIWETIRPDVERAVSKLGEIVVATAALIEITIQRVVQVTQFIWQKWGDDITRVVQIAWNLVAGVVNGALQIILGIINTATSILRGDWAGAWDGVKQILSGAWEIIKTIVSVGIDAAKETIKRGIAAIREVFNIDESVGNIRRAVDTIVSTFRGMPARLAGAFSGMWEGLWTGFRGVLNRIIGAWNNLEFSLPGFSAFGQEVGGQTIGTPNLPMVGGGRAAARPTRTFRGFASGGIGAGVALVGEQGPELVDFSSRMVRSAPDTERALGGMSAGGRAVNVTLNIAGSVLSERDLIAVVRDELVNGGLSDAFEGNSLVVA